MNPKSKESQFTSGQMVGMLVMMTFIENNPDIDPDFMRRLKQATASSVEDYFDKPTEDILLMIDKLVEGIEIQ